MCDSVKIFYSAKFDNNSNYWFTTPLSSSQRFAKKRSKPDTITNAIFGEIDGIIFVIIYDAIYCTTSGTIFDTIIA